MIILDTDVLSNLLRPQPSPNVVSWIKRTDPGTLATTSITIGEVRYGFEILPKGRRRNQAMNAFEDLIDRSYLRNAIYAYEATAAYRYAELAADLKRKGRLPGSVQDMQIAAIAYDRKAAVATGNVRHFQYSGITVIDPFNEPIKP
ncbi:MAG: type II toxin-antitoxin system VapC family toxin [Proteobacteria bacterium]|nr:type II toxin-antitoxin system VapC family toxin [Pseudomonadota bacterium]